MIIKLLDGSEVISVACFAIATADHIKYKGVDDVWRHADKASAENLEKVRNAYKKNNNTFLADFDHIFYKIVGEIAFTGEEQEYMDLIDVNRLAIKRFKELWG